LSIPLRSIEDARREAHKATNAIFDKLIDDLKPEGSSELVAALINAFGCSSPFTASDALTFAPDFETSRALGRYLPQLLNHDFNGVFLSKYGREKSGALFVLEPNTDPVDFD